MTTYEQWNLALQAIGALLVFGGLMYAGKQFRLSRQSESRNVKIESLEYAERLQAVIREPLAMIRSRREELNSESVPTEISESAYFVLNSIEGMFLRLSEGIYDEETIQKVWGITVSHTFDLLMPVVTRARKETGSAELWRLTEEGVARWGYIRR